MSGRMSAIAARTFARLGYRDLVELRGGMDAWSTTGHPLAATRDLKARCLHRFFTTAP
jgi:rhodanese-related sulfurtransferase